jgi:hypothetical protein
VGGKEALAEKGGVDAVRVVAFAYDTYTNPSKNNGVLGATLTVKNQHLILPRKGLRHGRLDSAYLR